MTDFSQYTDSILSALKNSNKDQDIINKKVDILNGIYEFYNLIPESILFVGFNPALLGVKTKRIYVTEIGKSARDYLDSRGVDYTYVDEDTLGQYNKQFDVVVAADEYFTFSGSDQNQIDKVKQICSLAREFVVSTLRDYKNQDYKDREFSIPAVARNNSATSVYTEFHDWHPSSKSQWHSRLYEINNTTGTLTTYGPFARHTMYFKQLAKFSIDSGAHDFVVHKNLMYKSVVKKNYEHVISIRFEDTWTYQNSSNQ
jgi:hypothetical protein